MQHIDIIQPIADLYARPAYLEIGVCDGMTFHAVSATRKVAVDIEFRFDLDQARAAAGGQDVHFHAMPSDRFFEPDIIGDDRFDLIFIDGLHTFDQTLRDLLNAMNVLKPGGTIVVDDVLPSSYAASLPSYERSIALRQETGNRKNHWMGDVYRLVFFIRDYLPAWRYATVGSGPFHRLILWQSPRRLGPTRTVEQISRLSYGDVRLEIDAYDIRPLDAVLDDLRVHVAAHRPAGSSPERDGD
ncbi:class I SAM-dependent methyltransferase [Sphingomonas sp. SRS2]|uniref:class I SAM-dependent methyltransferase n=1 Tax=Sphingomonas sp. SRS2 TaxID=133190 RepID=UPI0006184385|nr:class I SAM-dependent methyltransferase [Sphingomonas sp. SRS2]KKC27604.1 hypothetical protein WP12_02640 [Sphingomonas sp. SRS2]